MKLYMQDWNGDNVFEKEFEAVHDSAKNTSFEETPAGAFVKELQVFFENHEAPKAYDYLKIDTDSLRWSKENELEGSFYVEIPEDDEDLTNDLVEFAKNLN